MANRPNSTVNVTGTNGGVGFHSVDGTNVPVGYGGSVPVGKGINANGYAGASVAYGVGAGLLGMAVEYNPVVKSTTLSGSIMGIYGSYTSSPTGWQTDLGIGFIVGAGAHVKGYFASTIEQGAKIRSNWSAKVELEYIWFTSELGLDNIPECFPAGTLISLPGDKVLPIEAISVGDIVLAYDAAGALKPARVSRLYENVTDEWIELVWRDPASGKWRMLTATPGHVMLTPEGGFAELAAMLSPIASSAAALEYSMALLVGVLAGEGADAPEATRQGMPNGPRFGRHAGFARIVTVIPTMSN